MQPASPALSLTADVPRLPVHEALFVGTQPQAIAVSGAQAFVADIRGLTAVAIKPRSLSRLGSIATPGVARDIALVGDRAFVADGHAGVAIIEVANPEAPAVIAQVATPGEAVRVSAGRDRVAVLGHDSPLVSILDRDGRATMPPQSLDGPVEDAVWHGPDLYLARRGARLIQTRPDRGHLTPLWTAAVTDVRAMARRDDWLYAFTGTSRLHVFDLAGPTPREVAVLAVTQVPTRAFVAGDVLVGVGRVLEPARLIDIRTPGAPSVPTHGLLSRPVRALADAGVPDLVLAAEDTPGLSLLAVSRSDPPDARTVAELRGGRIAQFDRSGDGLLAFGAWRTPVDAVITDAWSGADLHAPTRVIALDSSASCTGAEIGAPSLTIACDRHLCKATRQPDFSDIIAIRALTGVDPDTAGASIAIREPARAMVYHHAARSVWVATSTGAIHAVPLVDEQAARAPEIRDHRERPIASVQLDGPRPWISALAVLDPVLVALDSRGALVHALSVSGGQVTARGHHALQARPLDVALARRGQQTLIAVAEWRFGVQILDATDPGDLRELLWQPTEPWPMAVDLLDRPDGAPWIALGLGSHGVALARWHPDQARLEPIGHVDTSGLATDVMFARGALWVADGSALLRVDLPEVE